MLNFSDIFKKYRKILNISQQELSEKTGISPVILSGYENGKRNPKLDQREQIARVLNIDPVEFSGIELSEIDEKRLLMKLLYKYANRIEMKEGTVSASFNPVMTNLEAFIEAYNYMNDFKKYTEEEYKNKNISEEEYKKKMIDAELTFSYYIYMYPKYDYVFQGNVLGINPYEGGRFSLKEQLFTNYIAESKAYERRLNSPENDPHLLFLQSFHDKSNSEEEIYRVKNKDKK